MCSQCAKKKGKCRVRFIVLMYRETQTIKETKILGSVSGFDLAVTRLKTLIHNEKNLAPYNVDLCQLGHLTDKKNTSEKFYTEDQKEFIFFKIIIDKGVKSL